MRPMRPSTMLLSCAIAGFVASAALAQAVNYTSVEATAGKPLQLSYHASAHKRTAHPPRWRRLMSSRRRSWVC